MLNNSPGKKQGVEDHRRHVKFSENKTSVTACNDSLNAKTLNVNFVCVTCGKCVLIDNRDMCVLHYLNGVNSRTKMPMVVPISTREPKHTVNQSVAKPHRRTVASESTNQKPRHRTRKLYEHVSKACSSWYPKFTPPGYKWKPKSQIANVNPNVSTPLGNASRTANILEPMTPSLSLGPQFQENVPQEAETVTTSNELDLLFSLTFDELLNGSTQVVSKSSAKNTADAPNQIQIHQSPHDIFINQPKYAQEILIKHGMTSCDNIGTPMATKHLDADLSGTPVDETKYQKKVEKGIVELFFVGTEYRLADLFTKALSEDRFKYLVRRLGMRCLLPEELEVLANESA
nr:uncharacterized mitochondrial protein AtMg00810-like [Tanacetum cinerariifolium]